MLEVTDSSSEETLLVGDSPFDYEAAEAGCLSAAYLVTTGTHNAEQLAEETAANGIYPDLFQLAKAVFNLSPPAGHA
jgi:phosphoglycolate phosphatase-like HAD superfamily hydrolase